MRHHLLRSAAVVALAATQVLAVAPSARAESPSALSEVIVTARKRQESILNVPVVETVVPKERMERLQTQSFKDIATLVTGLALGGSTLSVGTLVSIRGVGTTSYDAGVDQSVALNIDGLQLSNGLAYQSGLFDAGQVEVLKGPQALFYGKSSPGGVISVRTADPTSTPEIIARLGYEAEAREKRAELIVSGPLTDTLKGRLAGYYSNQDGFYKNVQQGPLVNLGGVVAPKRLLGGYSWMIRGTLLWNPASNFDARLKLTNAKDYSRNTDLLQIAACPDGLGPVFGLQFLNPNDDCKLNRSASWVDVDPKVFPNVPNGGKGFNSATQTYGTLEMNYRPRSDITVTSATGVYLVHSNSLFEATASSDGAATIVVPNGFRRRDVTQEIRVNSDFAGPLNFTAGGFLERGRFSNLLTVYGNTLVGYPALAAKGGSTVHVKTNSLFGQGRYKITPKLELAAGARWTDETRNQTGIAAITGVDLPVNILVPRINSKNVSPEVSLTYKPTDQVTLFANAKQGYKSGSFNVSSPPLPGVNTSFGDEKVQGGEIGLKSLWLDRALLFNAAVYYYKYTGLQVGAVLPTEGVQTTTTTLNAGKAQVKGAEAEVVYRPPQIENLSLNASLAYNDAHYNELDHVPCYNGQTIAQGCNELFNATANTGSGGFTAQNDSGLPLVRSAKWQAHFGFDWETEVGHDMKIIVTNSNQYSSRYLVNLSEPFYQKPFLKTDLSLTLQGPRDRWEIALIGKNLTDRLTTGNCTNFNGQGALLPGTSITGALPGNPQRGPGGVDEIGCWMDRGRELWVRVTFKPLS